MVINYCGCVYFFIVARETRQRHKLEKKFNDYIKTSDDTIKRYETCLVHLGKEVSQR